MIKLLSAGVLGAILLAATPAFAQMNHDAHGADAAAAASGMPVEAGQSAFAAIQEIVAKLGADPETDWSKVDIDGLRQHLVDMDELIRNAAAATVDIDKGVRISITGKGRTLRAIQAMVPAHAMELDKIAGWSAEASVSANGAQLTVTSADGSEAQKIRALGIFGLMATGAHHQRHHWAMATGASVHAE